MHPPPRSAYRDEQPDPSALRASGLQLVVILSATKDFAVRLGFRPDVEFVGLEFLCVGHSTDCAVLPACVH